MSNFFPLLFEASRTNKAGNHRVSCEEAASMKNKIIVESNEIYWLGIQEKAFKPENVIVVNKTWHHVQKPTDGKPKCIILWARDNPQDTNPMEGVIPASLVILFTASVMKVKCI